ncbi:MAG TPA: ATP-binding protein [Candidatus Eisenbacteria bacterium]|nr:ATP-binding protein [Candidatus Eisenbacteria bacterium]
MRTLLSKLLLASLAVILLPVGVAILWSSKTLSALLERRFEEKSMAHAEQIQVFLAEKQETVTGLVHWIAEMPGVKRAIRNGDRDRLFQHLLPLVGSIQLDFIEVLDGGGAIVLRVHDPTRYGDSPALSADIRALLRGIGGMSNYGIESRDGKAYLRAAEIIEGDGVLGVVSAGYAINRDLIKKLEQIAGGSVRVAIGDRTYAAGDGSPIAARAESLHGPLQERVSFWHRGGQSPVLEIRLPLRTDRGSEGTIAILFSAQEMAATLRTLHHTLIMIALAGVAVALAVSWFLSRRLTRPLQELVSGTQQVTAGNYEGCIAARSRDEIGTLADSFNSMLGELRRSRNEIESYRRKLEKKVEERSEQLVQTEKKRAAMAHMIAHDLKNPLLGIKKTLERLEQRPGDLNGPQREKILTDLLSAGDLVIGMVNEMLDIYRSDFGEIPLSRSSFEIAEVIQASLRILGPDIEEKNLRVITDARPCEVPLVADKRRLTRLLINLLGNAIKFSAPGRRIFVDAAARQQNGAGPCLELRVEDEGPGVPEADLSKIFDPFYSQDKEKAEIGTGLGLPYCKLVAEAHGGSISARNRAGGGFVVSVLLPLGKWERERFYAA